MGDISDYITTNPQKLGKLIDTNGNNINFQISNSGGTINLNSGKTDNNGFYVAVVGDEGILKIRFLGQISYTVLPFFNGWNPTLVTEVAVYSGNTATDIYWGN